MEDVIVVEDLERIYKTKKGFIKKKIKIIKAVDKISFTVKKGEVFGLLGENGAGKTTTIKMLITLLAPTSGICKVLGYNTFGEEKKIRKNINFIFGGELGVYRRLSARDNLQYFANLYYLPLDLAKKRIEEVLELVGLKEKADILVETYSKGMIQRLQIARGLMNDSEIIFMDEPTIGLDPLGARMLRDIIKKIKAYGKTVVLTTHYMYEADELCDRIAIMNKGKIVALDTPKGLKSLIEPYKTMELTTRNQSSIYTDSLKKISGVINVEHKKNENLDTYIIKYDNNTEIVSEALSIVKDIVNLSQKDISLEDVFISLVGNK